MSGPIARKVVQFFQQGSQARKEGDELSVREREVLQLVAEGHGNQSIARKLTLSVKTVEAHKSHICQKLGVRGRTELIKYAIRKGLIDLELERPNRAREREAIPA